MSALPHLESQFHTMRRGARQMDLGSWEDEFDEMARAAREGTITAEQIAKLIDYDYQTNQDGLAAAMTLIDCLLRDARRPRGEPTP